MAFPSPLAAAWPSRNRIKVARLPSCSTMSSVAPPEGRSCRNQENIFSDIGVFIIWQLQHSTANAAKGSHTALLEYGACCPCHDVDDYAPAARVSSFSTIGSAILRPAADACSAGRLDAARARPSTTSLRQFFFAPALPAHKAHYIMYRHGMCDSCGSSPEVLQCSSRGLMCNV